MSHLFFLQMYLYKLMKKESKIWSFICNGVNIIFLIVCHLHTFCMWVRRVAWSILWALGAWDSGSNPGGPIFPALAQFGRALDCRSKCCWFKSGRRDFQFIYLKSYNFLWKKVIFPQHLYMMKIILIDSYYLRICPGGVGAIMWACRARDSGSNPGQGA